MPETPTDKELEAVGGVWPVTVQDVARWLTELCEARERLKELEAQLASLRAALEQHRVDLHEYSSRPCPTCRKSAEALGLKGLPDTCAPRRLAEAREGK